MLSTFAKHLLLLALFLPVGALHAETCALGVDMQGLDPADAPRIHAAGTVQFKGAVSVPAYAMTLHSGSEDSGVERFDPASRTLDRTLSASQAERLALYAHSWGWILVPRGWRAVRGAVGANGSESLLFVAPDRSGHVAFSHASACVGCAMSAASALFPEARKSARADGFDACDGADLPVQSVNIRPHMKAWRAQDGQRQIDGLSYYNPQDDAPWFQISVSLPASQRDLATPILNLFLPPKAGSDRP